MQPINTDSQQPNVKPNEESTYEAPAIIYKGIITTRAGSSLPGGEGDIDPADLFGND